VGRRCAAAAGEAIGRASALCYAALFAIEPTGGTPATLDAARNCLKKAYRRPFRNAGLERPRLAPAR